MRKINHKKFIELFYIKNLPIKQVAEILGVRISSIGSHRNRNRLPPRGHSGEVWNKGKKLHYNVWNKGKKGINSRDKNPNWCGGKFKNVHGYFVINVGKISGAYKNCMLEHRYVMQKHIGRILKSNEIVHHKNGNKLDNRIENLAIISRSEHAKLHFPKGSKFGIHSNS